MKTEKQYFDEAISLEVYMDKMEAHKDNSFLIYEKFDCPKDDEFIELLKEAKPDILVITEDWCGDAMLNNPILRKIGEAANLDIRTVNRDEHPDLIERHLTNGGKSIPIYLLFDKDGEVMAKWGPRAATLQEYVMELRESLPSSEAPEYKEEQQSFIKRLSSEYTSKPEHWLAVYEDLRKTWLPVVQRSS